MCRARTPKRARHTLLCGLALMGASAFLPSALLAQDPPLPPVPPEVEQRAGRSVSQGEILQAIQQSGLSRSEARQRLIQQGHNPGLVDPYFDALEGRRGERGAETLPEANSDFLEALGAMGLAFPEVDPDAPGTPDTDLAAVEMDEVEDAPDTVTDPGPTGTPAIFGLNLFQRTTQEFTPLWGPADPDYRLGPRDQIVLILTGDVELAYTLEASAEGLITIPQVGQIPVNGLTLGELRERLYDRLGRVYSGVRRDADAPTQFHVSLGRMRTNQIYIIGEARQPGAYQVSAASTVFNALHLAGGPSEGGSFRQIQVRRGNRLIRTIDIYRYLLHGDSSEDIRLEHGDIVFVPPAGRLVMVDGRVRRPAIFELKDGEDLQDALRFAGGIRADGFTGRVQVDRILPPAERLPDRERTVLDVSPNEPLSLHDRDAIRVFAISDQRRDNITLRGEVVRPGSYQYRAGMTLWDAIRRADGLLADAYRPAAHVIRVSPEDGRAHLHRVVLDLDEDGEPVSDFYLEDHDEIVIYGQVSLLSRRYVEIQGPVRNSGTFPFAESMTVKDLILAAGGTEPRVLPDRAHIARRRPDGTRELLRFELDPDSMGVPRREVALQPDDEVRIYNRDALLLRDEVEVIGLVQNPGSFRYDAGMTLQDVLLKAGGFERGARHLELEVSRRMPGIERTDTLVSVLRVPLVDGEFGASSNNSDEAHRGERAGGVDWRPRAEEFRLEGGDHVFVRRLAGYAETATIEIAGEVGYPGRYPVVSRTYRLSDAIKASGGLTSEAHPGGFRLVRQGVPVAVDLRLALNNPGSSSDVVLTPGDRLEVPIFDPTVYVVGGVNFEARVVYRPGQSLKYYIEQAGGYHRHAAVDRLSITYQNGMRATRRRNLLFDRWPKVEPGSIIYVPMKGPDERDPFDWGRFTQRTLQIVGTVASIIVAVDRLR